MAREREDSRSHKRTEAREETPQRRRDEDVFDEPVVQAREEAEEQSLEEEHRAVEDAYARDAEDHRASIDADEKLGTPPSFPVDPVKGENSGAPSR